MAEVVIVCEPEQASLMMGGLHPRGSLYERPVNIDTAKQQHSEFRNVSWGGACVLARGLCITAVVGLHPRGSLYERPVNIDTAKQQELRWGHVC